MKMPEMDGASKDRDVHVLNFDIHFGGKTLLNGADLHLAYVTTLTGFGHFIQQRRRPLAPVCTRVCVCLCVCVRMCMCEHM